MKIYQSIMYILFLGALITTTGCLDKYEEYNRDQSGATQEEMERDGYIIRSYIMSMQSWVIPADANANQFIECLLGGSYGGYLADSNDGFNNRNFATYGPEEHWIQVAFNDVIPNIMTNYTAIYAATDDPVILAVADIIKVMALSRVTDIYGPIPYSQIGVDGKTSAPYDSQEEVYTHMFNELDEAIETLTERRADNFSSKADRVYNGNVEKWIKLANSLKLRMAMRIVNANPSLAQTKAQEAALHEVGTLSSNEDNAFMSIANTNPFRTVMYEYNDGDTHIGADITSYMNGYNDPRRAHYFTESTFADFANGYYGIRSGITIPSSPTIKQYSNILVDTKSPLMWMNAAEPAFLKAEGALRGWNMGAPEIPDGSTVSSQAEGFYNMGIRLSFEQ